jgi:hypothetical protein
VVQKYRSTEDNLRTTLGRIADVAGVEKWPKPFMALRASRRTELERAGFKNHVLNDWFGHTGAIAETHYLQTTEADFEAATGTDSQNGATASSVAPLVAPSREEQPASASISSIKKLNKKGALMALSALLMLLEVHPSGSEPSTKSPANSLGKRRKGPSVAPLVAPSASDLTPLHAIELIERFYQLDDSGRAGLLKFARELSKKRKCQ